MTKQFSNYSDLLTYTRASKGHALRPVSYGTELVTNGDGSSTDGWTTANTTLSIVSEALRVTATGSSATASQGVSTVVGKVYKFSASLNGGTAVDQIRVGTAINTATGGGSLASTGEFVFVATTLTTYITLKAGDVSGLYADFDNISVKEVLFDQPDGTLTLFEHPEGVPRVEYDADGNRLGLLVEEARTNLLTYSEDLNNPTWRKGTGTTVTSSTTTAPNGIAGCFRVQFTAGVRQGRYVQDILTPSPLASTTHTVSVWVKSTSGTDQTFSLKCTHGGVVDYFSSNFTATSKWQRFDFSQAFGSGGTSAIVGVAPDSSGNAADLEVWGFQFEADASFPTSYIKTTGSTATRSADVASIPVADFGYNQSAGTVFVEAKASGDSLTFPRVISFQDDPSNRWELIGDTTLDVRIFHRSNGTTDVSSDIISNVLDGETSFKLAYAKAENDAAGSGNGGSVVTDTSNGQLNNVDTLYIGVGANGSSDFLNGHIKSIKYFPRRLTNAQLVDLTS